MISRGILARGLRAVTVFYHMSPHLFHSRLFFTLSSWGILIQAPSLSFYSFLPCFLILTLLSLSGPSPYLTKK